MSSFDTTRIVRARGSPPRINNGVVTKRIRHCRRGSHKLTGRMKAKRNACSHVDVEE